MIQSEIKGRFFFPCQLQELRGHLEGLGEYCTTKLMKNTGKK